MEITGDHRFNAPAAVTWEALLDPAAIQASMPGCERFDPVGPDTYDITIRVGIAAIKGTYSGRVSVKDRVEGQSYRLVVEGNGKPGSVQGDATLTLQPEGESTLVRYQGDVRAQGAIARLGSRLLGGTAKLMIGQFMKGMEKQVTARA